VLQQGLRTGDIYTKHNQSQHVQMGDAGGQGAGLKFT